jgi:hypothetical protein
MHTGERRSALERDRDRELSVALSLKGHSQLEIADRLASLTGRRVSQQTISRDLAAVRAEWIRQAVTNADELIGAELARLNLLERSAWAAFAGEDFGPDMLQPEGSSRETSTAAQRRKWVGDPRCLTIILRCIERRCALLGLDGARRVDVTFRGANGLENKPAVTAEDTEKARALLFDLIENPGGNGRTPGSAGSRFEHPGSFHSTQDGGQT